MICAILVLTCSSCRTRDSITNNTPASTFTSIRGTGAIEGYVGYFSAELPPGGGAAYPSGYAVSSHHWLTDSPKVSYWMIFFVGKENELLDAVYLRVAGPWQTKQTASGKTYIEMRVDSLEVIERRHSRVTK